MNPSISFKTAGIAALVLAVSFSQADSLKYLGTDLGSHVDQVKVSLYGGHSSTVDAGVLKFKDSTTHTTLFTVCADLGSILNGSSHSYSISSTNPLGTTGIDLAGKIVASFLSSAVTANEQAGLQLAVWAAIYNGGTSLNLNGTFKASNYNSATASYAQTYYAAVNNNFGSATYYRTSANGGQSQLAPQAVPEPASIGALALGLVGLISRKRKK